MEMASVVANMTSLSTYWRERINIRHADRGGGTKSFATQLVEDGEVEDIARHAEHEREPRRAIGGGR